MIIRETFGQNDRRHLNPVIIRKGPYPRTRRFGRVLHWCISGGRWRARCARLLKGVPMRRLFSVLFAAVLAAALFALAGCASGENGSSSSGETVTLDAEGVMFVQLKYSAGTGFEWECSVAPEGVLSIVSQETVDASNTDEPITGGPLCDYVTVRAIAPGHAVLTCQLCRPWENGEPAEEQTFDFTVDDKLQITFNPEASDYLIEPEVGSNS